MLTDRYQIREDKYNNFYAIDYRIESTLSFFTREYDLRKAESLVEFIREKQRILSLNRYAAIDEI